MSSLPAAPAAPVEVLRHRPGTTQIFEFSAVTENSHRIHYDKDYAEAEGYPAVLVQSHLHEALLARACRSWAGELADVAELAVTMRRFATAGDVLVFNARRPEPSELHSAPFEPHLVIDEIRDSDDTVCATALARLRPSAR